MEEEANLVDKDGTRVYAESCLLCGNFSLKMQTIEGKECKYFVVCIKCGFRGKLAITKAEAIKLWNGRLIK